MPAPDGREWLTSLAVAEQLLDMFVATYPDAVTCIQAAGITLADVKDLLRQAYEDTGYSLEHKTSRLTEKLKDSIEARNFGPLFVNDDGDEVMPADYEPANPSHHTTQAYDIWLAFKDIYTMTTLDCFDEEGNFIC
jgi:hypothetical protein